jgi:hypothetical protein
VAFGEEDRAIFPPDTTPLTAKRGNRWGLWVVATLVVLVAGFIGYMVNVNQPPEHATSAFTSGSGNTPKAFVKVTFSSDPSGATLFVNGKEKGVTPITVSLEKDSLNIYALTVEEPYESYSLYKRFAGELIPSKDESISVWIERTTNEEQAAQIAKFEEEQRAAEQRRLEQERQACLQRTWSSPLVLESFRWYTEYGYAIAEGLVTNRSGVTLENLMVVVEFYTADDTFITADDALVEYTTLLPGQSTPFKVYADENPVMETARVGFTDFYGGLISHVRLSELEACQ